jgi:cytidine deaminase
MSMRNASEDVLATAWHAREAAYAPYSGFKVGAAVLAGSGRVYPGANVENASYGLTICAERAAICAAISAGERQILVVAVVSEADTVTPPCGACRQVIWEFGKDATVIAENRHGDRREWQLVDLLPDAFGRESIS